MPGQNAKRCPCCGQRSNLRKLACTFCDAYAYTSLAQMRDGYHACRCGQGELRPVCLVDRAQTDPDPVRGREAYAEYAWKFDHEPCPILSARAKKGAQTRKLRETFAAVRDPATPRKEEMPF